MSITTDILKRQKEEKEKEIKRIEKELENKEYDDEKGITLFLEILKESRIRKIRLEIKTDLHREDSLYYEIGYIIIENVENFNTLYINIINNRLILGICTKITYNGFRRNNKEMINKQLDMNFINLKELLDIFFSKEEIKKETFF